MCSSLRTFCTEVWPAEQYGTLSFPPLLMLASEFHVKRCRYFLGIHWWLEVHLGTTGLLRSRQKADPFLPRVHTKNEIQLLSHHLQITSVDSFLLSPHLWHVTSHIISTLHLPQVHTAFGTMLLTHHTSRMLPLAWRALLQRDFLTAVAFQDIDKLQTELSKLKKDLNKRGHSHSSKKTCRAIKIFIYNPYTIQNSTLHCTKD